MIIVHYTSAFFYSLLASIVIKIKWIDGQWRTDKYKLNILNRIPQIKVSQNKSASQGIVISYLLLVIS